MRSCARVTWSLRTVAQWGGGALAAATSATCHARGGGGAAAPLSDDEAPRRQRQLIAFDLRARLDQQRPLRAREAQRHGRLAIGEVERDERVLALHDERR